MLPSRPGLTSTFSGRNGPALAPELEFGLRIASRIPIGEGQLHGFVRRGVISRYWKRAISGLCSRFPIDIPIRENEDCGMNFESSRENLCSLYAKVYSVAFDG